MGFLWTATSSKQKSHKNFWMWGKDFWMWAKNFLVATSEKLVAFLFFPMAIGRYVVRGKGY